MKTLKTKTITIEYENKKEQEALKLKSILDSNPMFFKEFLDAYQIIRISEVEEPLTDEDTLEVESLEELKELLVILIPYYINKLNVKKDDETLITYLKILLADKYNAFHNYKLNLEEEKLSEYIESVYSLVAIDYYDEPKDVIESLFNLSEEEKKKLLDYLNNKYRNELLNVLLQEQVNFLNEVAESKDKESFVLDNIDILLEYITYEMLTIDLSKQEQIEIPILTEDELNKLIVEFLIKIDPSLKWLKEYQELKQNDGIHKSNTWNCANENDKWIININLTNTIEDFRNFIHEFIHYITVKNNNDEKLPPALKEFPSIYFETLAVKFLEQKGYPKESTNYMLSERNEWTEENVYDLYLIISLLSIYLKDYEVNLENELERRLTIKPEVKQKIPSELSFFYEMINHQINYSFDVANGYMILFPESIYEEYPYITGTYLADKAVEVTEHDPMFIYDMLSITDNLETTNPNEVISLINQKHKQLTKKHETK